LIRFGQNQNLASQTHSIFYGYEQVEANMIVTEQNNLGEGGGKNLSECSK